METQRRALNVFLEMKGRQSDFEYREGHFLVAIGSSYKSKMQHCTLFLTLSKWNAQGTTHRDGITRVFNI